MSLFLSELELVAVALFDVMADIFTMMMNTPILTAVLALWVLDRVFGIFDYLKG